MTAVSGSSTPETVTVSVAGSLPHGLVSSGSEPQTFAVDGNTLVLGAGDTSPLAGPLSSDVSVGDVVAGGLEGAGGMTLSEVESTPLKVLVDFRASSGTSASRRAGKAAIRAKALNQAVSLLRTETGRSGKGKNGSKRNTRDANKKRKHSGRSHTAGKRG